MSDTVIKVENLSKQYRIGSAKEGYRTFRETLVDAAKAPFQKISSLINPKSAFRSPQSETIWALKDVSFEVKRGEVVGIIGRNGAGKSTLLKVVSKITEPTKGRVEIRGRVGSLLEVGTGFHPELTGHENVYLYGAILGMDRWEVTRKFDEIIAFAELEKFIETPVKRYSSGMYMRLAFAVAAHMETEILLVDEVLAVGDVAFQKKCMGKMGSVASEGRTVLFVSHNMNAIERLCQTGLLLDNGHIVRYSADVRSVIKQHILEQEGKINSSEWNNTQKQLHNPWFTPLRFYISDESGERISMPISNDSEIWIYIEAEIQEIDTALTVGYAIYTENDHLLYWAYQTDSCEDKWPKLHKGINIIRGKIPSRFLNEGAYRIELIGGLHYRQWLFEPGKSVPYIFLTIKGGLSESPHWMVRRPGILAPVTEWVLVK